MPLIRALRARTVLVALVLSVAALAVPAIANAEWQRGVNFTTYGAWTYSGAGSDSSLQRAAADGNNSVEIIPTWFQQDATSTTIAPNGSTTTDASVLHAMQTAHALGMRVVLKPHDHTVTGTWVGTLAPSDVNAWFASYQNFIYHYADLAQQGGASQLVVGTELKSLSGSAYTSRWQQIIAGIRQRFSGKLTYAANWNEYGQVKFWGSLDYIGVDAYFPLVNTVGASVSDLVSAWTSRGYVDSLHNISTAYGRPVLFTEIGYRSVSDTAIHPNIWTSTGTIDLGAQATAYEAAFETFAGRPWFAGMYWWNWPATLPSSGSNDDYPPVFKPAESVMSSWNATLAAASQPAATTTQVATTTTTKQPRH
jgi:hypothetical protein